LHVFSSKFHPENATTVFILKQFKGYQREKIYIGHVLSKFHAPRGYTWVQGCSLGFENPGVQMSLFTCTRRELAQFRSAGGVNYRKKKLKFHQSSEEASGCHRSQEYSSKFHLPPPSPTYLNLIYNKSITVSLIVEYRKLRIEWKERKRIMLRLLNI